MIHNHQYQKTGIFEKVKKDTICLEMVENKKLLLLDPITLSAEKSLELAGFKIDRNYDFLTEPQLLKKVSEYHVVVVANERNEIYLTDEVLRSAHKLLAIGVFSRFSNQIDYKTAQSMGIPIFKAPYQHQHSIAELVKLKKIFLTEDIHSGFWRKVSDGCHEVRGKVLGLVGYGQIGSQLGVMAEALSMRVIFYDDVSLMPIGRAEEKSLNEVLSTSDFVTVNVSDRKDNIKFIGRNELNLMKKGSYILNASFSEAIDLVALAEALESKHLNGAALDSFSDDIVNGTWPNDIIARLAKQDNVILTPQIGALTTDAAERISNEVSHSLIRYLHDGSTVGSINFPTIVTWPLKDGTRRILNIHRNVRGVLKEIDSILSSYNVGKQVLDTHDGYGYLIADIATDSVTTEIVSQLALL
ncbi:hypothetical protein HK099_007403, partial [Clydaea vesicula]